MPTTPGSCLEKLTEMVISQHMSIPSLLVLQGGQQQHETPAPLDGPHVLKHFEGAGVCRLTRNLTPPAAPSPSLPCLRDHADPHADHFFGCSCD